MMRSTGPAMVAVPSEISMVVEDSWPIIRISAAADESGGGRDHSGCRHASANDIVRPGGLQGDGVIRAPPRQSSILALLFQAQNAHHPKKSRRNPADFCKFGDWDRSKPAVAWAVRNGTLGKTHEW
jgi:hypothetical protein